MEQRKFLYKDYICEPMNYIPCEVFTGYSFKNESANSILKVANEIKLIENSSIIKLPLNPYTEAQAFGAKVEDNFSGVPTLLYHQDSILSLKLSGQIVNQNPVNQILECIRKVSSETIMLEVQAPFSVLANLLEPLHLFKELSKNESEVKRTLDHIVEELYRYITTALQYGVDIISIADPIASIELLGVVRYREYVAEYLIRLLKMLLPKLDHAIVHICPRSSYLLEKLKLVKSSRIDYITDSYTNSLLQLTSEDSVKLVGHQCIHRAKPEQIYRIDIIDL